jgi:hypothetical protein
MCEIFEGKLSKKLNDNIYIEFDGKELFVDGNALEALRLADIFYEVSVMAKGYDGEPDRQAIALAVGMNDIFWWACADYELFAYKDIQSLYEMCFDREGNYKEWGSVHWACLQRGMRPQHPIEDIMKKDGAWTDDLEALPVRGNTG